MKTDEKHRQLFAALGRVASGLFIVTMSKCQSKTGMLASWVQQCSFEPPLITLAVARERYVADWMTDDAEFTLNILHESQTDMIAHFGKGFAPNENAFAGLEMVRSDGSGPVLSEVIGYLDCRVAARITPGDHHLVVAEIIDGRLLSEDHPMVHVRKNGSHY